MLKTSSFSVVPLGQSLLAAAAGAMLVMAPATADTLQTWRLDGQQNRLDFSTDEEVRPIAQLVPNPERVVIDLPGIRLKRPKLEQSVGGAIKTMRIGQFDATTTRLVIELAPGYRIDPREVRVSATTANRWTVQLPTPEFTGAPSESTEPVAIAVAAPPAPVISSPVSDASSGIFSNGRSLEWLQQRLLSLNTGRYASLRPGMYFLDLETGNYLSIGGDRVVPTASVIKLPILIAFFQEVEAGRIRLDETLVMTRDVLVGESGYMQNQPVGSKFSALQTATNMIITSDNTATNMIIKRIGGFEAVNRRFRSWGLQKTMVRNKLPDLGATNKTTAKELVQLLAMVEQGKLLAAPARQQALDILRRVRNKRLLPVGLGPGAAIAHKTGYIRSVLGDAGIIYMPNGKRYLAAVLVENNAAPATARGYIQEVSRIVYAYMAQASGISAAASLPAQSDAIAPTNEAPETD